MGDDKIRVFPKNSTQEGPAPQLLALRYRKGPRAKRYGSLQQICMTFGLQPARIEGY